MCPGRAEGIGERQASGGQSLHIVEADEIIDGTR
jgi:hypothetical protein